MSVYVFSSPLCVPCQTIKPAIQELKEDFPTLNWIFINTIDDITGLTKKYEIEKVPTIVVDSPKGIERHTGTQIMGYYKILRNATSQ